MKTIKIVTLVIMLISMTGIKAYSYSIKVENPDGVAVYYNNIGDFRLEVTNGPSKYSGNIVIPDEVIYLNKTYKVTSIGKRAFYECKDLISVSIGNNVTFIDEYAFADCSGLTTLILGNSLDNTGIYAFRNCVGISTLKLPDSMAAIGGGAFVGCTSLESIILPDNLTTIGASAFAGCSSVITISIGKNVSSIGGNAFACGDKVETVYSQIEDPFVIEGRTSGSMVFRQSTFKYAILYVPDDSIDKYKATKGWQDFVTIKPISDITGIIPITIDIQNPNAIVYDLNGRLIEKPSKGLYIKNGKKYVVK